MFYSIEEKKNVPAVIINEMYDLAVEWHNAMRWNNTEYKRQLEDGLEKKKQEDENKKQ